MNAKTVLDLLRVKHSSDVFVPECKNGPSMCSNHLRLDAWAMNKSWSNMVIKGYEIKVSRSDFIQDNKWQLYLDYCHEFYFVAPKGIINPLELPPEAGLLVVASTGTRLFTKKKSVRRPDVEIPESLYQYILMCRAKIEGEYEAEKSDREYWERWLERRKEDHELGQSVSRKIQDIVKERILNVESENYRLEKENASLSEVKKMLKENDIPISKWNLATKVQERIDEIKQGMSKELLNNMKSVIGHLTEITNKIEGKATS